MRQSILGVSVVRLLASASLALGCSRPPIGDETGETGETGDGDGDGDGDGGGTSELQIAVNKDVDILFVIDNSGSMGEEQAALASNVAAFINVLEAPGVDANYRIGITTTDNGNPWCPAGSTTPEAGRLVLSSCRSRLGDFVFGDFIDVQDLACNDICALSDAELEVQPTTTDVDPNPASRPWLERIEGQRNLPAGTDPAAALACFMPQGVNGCGFESQLESMYLALIRAQSSGEVSYGFLRPHAILAVVILTDEADCSYNSNYAEIFDAEGDKVFWSDPNAAFPTSALCWNAGVECIGDPSGYDSCDSVNKGVNGQLNVPDGEAVLHPMSRYIDLLAGLEQQKQQLYPDQEIIVSLIAGVGDGGETFYADVGDIDPEFQNSFGIGPGCTAPGDITAVPPVRLRDLINNFTPGNMHSICAPDYSPALEAVANGIRDQLVPACFTQCVADGDPDTPLVEPTCVVRDNPPGNGDDDIVEIPECLRDAGGYLLDPQTSDYAMPAADVNACYAILTDAAALTGDPLDDMSAECLDNGVNLEFKLTRRPGFPAVGGTVTSAQCELAADPAASCPGLGG